MKQKHQLLVLFLKTLYISAFTFGGGFVIVTFMKKCFVDELHWIDDGGYAGSTAVQVVTERAFQQGDVVQRVIGSITDFVDKLMDGFRARLR